MDPKDLQPHDPKTGDDAPPSTSGGNFSERIFEISEDTISPLSREALVGQPETKETTDTTEQGKHSTPPPEADLLDTKIGTFDPSPFAPPIKKTAPSSLGTIQSKPVAPPVSTPPHAKSLQEEAYAALPANLRPKPAVPPQPVAPTPPPVSLPPRPLPPDTMPREIPKPLRTYEGDVAEAMSHKRTSQASIAIAESKKQEQGETISNEKEEPSHAGKKITMLAISLVLLCGGAYGAYYLYSKSALAPVTPVVPQQQAAPSIIPATNQVVVTIRTESPALIRQRLSDEIQKPQAPNTIRELIVATQDTAGTSARVTAQDMLRILDIHAPDVLSRSLTATWMLGVYSDADNTKSVFIVGTTNFFQNAFAGMLQWERVMADDLRQYLYSDTIEYAAIRGTFEDRIIKNKDVRAFRTDDGKILFLYSFIDNAHVVVTDKESTLAEILSRLEKQSFIR